MFTECQNTSAGRCGERSVSSQVLLFKEESPWSCRSSWHCLLPVRVFVSPHGNLLCLRAVGLKKKVQSTGGKEAILVFFHLNT